MKNIVKFIFMMLAGVIALSSCGEREYPWDDFSMETVRNEGKVFLSFVNRDFFRDYLDENGIPKNEVVDLYVRVLGPPPREDIEVTFAVAEPSTAIAGVHFIPESNVFTIKAGELSGKLRFTFIEEAFTPGVVESLYLELTGTSSTSYTLHDRAISTMYRFMQNCVLNIFIFDGLYNLYVDGDLDSEDIVVSNNPSAGTITAAPIWTGACSVTLDFHEDGTLTGENQLTGGDYGDPFGLVEFEDINGGQVLNTCTGDFEFYATPTLTGGYWWGGEFHFQVIYEPDGKKSVTVVGMPESIRDMEPIKRE